MIARSSLACRGRADCIPPLAQIRNLKSSVILSEAKDLCSCFLGSAACNELRKCFADFTLNKLQRSFASLRMTANGLSMTGSSAGRFNGQGPVRGLTISC